ncbi:cytochrome P450 [Mycena alexandri]|uniref:Cytochrome P450 n=1 Tax=Mycena alexandri TaxID=1745969 RepID=A0AAD6XCP1_9AGAR|nr:cytochrome P450 [Mycena alexandri]
MAVSYIPPSEGFWRTLETSPTIIILLFSFCFIVFGFLSARSKSRDKDSAKMYHLGGYPMLSAWLFFTKRYDFMCGTFKRTGQKMFRFRVLQHHVVALSGEEGRKAFLSEKNFDLQEGYRILGGPAPDPRDINIEPVDGGATLFVKHVLNLFRKDRIMDVTPHLLEDVNRRMDDWGKSGKINPFQEMYNLIFQMTVRMGTCRELADDPQATARLSKFFLLHEKAASPISLLLPWLPGRAKQAKEQATRGLYDLLSQYVDLRRRSSVRSADAIDMLVADGHDDATAIAFTLGIIFAGVVNTGINVCWTIIYLGDEPGWKQKVVDEVKTLLFNHGSTTGPIHQRFSAVPLNAWEEEMPVLDAVIKETIRFTMSGTALRRNIGGDMLIAHKTVRNGDFLAYSLGDIHFDDQIYPNPLSFDPDRFLEPREDASKVLFPFLGWGAGRHPCAGMRAAKLEIKFAIALFLSKFEYSVVDASGKAPKCLPQPDRNNIQNAKPLGDPCYLKFERLEIM